MTLAQINESVREKDRRLGQILREMGKVMVAFSGGVDSTFVLKRAHRNSAMTCLLSSLPRKRSDTGINAAVALAEDMGVKLLKTRVSELANANFVANNPDRCYHCKTGLYSHLKQVAKENGYPYILDGSTVDDLGDYRPGLKAKEEQGVRSVLQEAGLRKAEIRMLSKELGLPTWNKPSFACLSSRIPYGTRIDQKKIDQLDEAENFLFELGFYQVGFVIMTRSRALK